MKINLMEYLRETTKKYPEKIGFEDADSKLNFKEFFKISENISTHLCQKNLHSSPIAIFLPKGIDSLLSLAGILLSGNVYMPLDIKSPKQRLQAILENIKPALIITDKENALKLQDLELQNIKTKDLEILLIEDLKKEVQEIQTNFENCIDTDPAYIINTSGSTGIPKGVVVSHRSIIDYIEWILSEEAICPKVDDVIGNQSPFYFDNSVLDIYLCFFKGVKLVLIPEEKFVFPIELLRFIEEKEINYIFWVPSLLKNIQKNSLLDTLTPKLSTILFAGETMPAKALNYWRKYYPKAIFGNLYGPTEITVDCTFYLIDRDFKDNENIPIGKTCRNTEILLFDEYLKLIKSPNIAGEICVRGSSLSLGYYNDLNKTNGAFIQNPLHNHYPEKIYKTGDLGYYNDRGEIILLGRKDYQVKINGYRIELGEIENALSDMEGMDSLCVLYDKDENLLELFYEAKSEISKAQIHHHLKDKIPKYMYPQRLFHLDILPLNANGKIDRLQLANISKNLQIKENQ